MCSGGFCVPVAGLIDARIFTSVPWIRCLGGADGHLVLSIVLGCRRSVRRFSQVQVQALLPGGCKHFRLGTVHGSLHVVRVESPIVANSIGEVVRVVRTELGRDGHLQAGIPTEGLSVCSSAALLLLPDRLLPCALPPERVSVGLDCAGKGVADTDGGILVVDLSRCHVCDPHIMKELHCCRLRLNAETTEEEHALGTPTATK
mmetsp:Transcript_20550/g.48938  ORF Transcript_20550/g.48938 Transcript_20550/m.48938 type:complete len:203 (+) Transcript_20550:593-1201(+)